MMIKRYISLFIIICSNEKNMESPERATQSIGLFLL
jgi:hypothetical protein